MVVIKNLLLLTPMFKGEIKYEKKYFKRFTNWKIKNQDEFARRNVNPDWYPISRGRPLINEETGEEHLYVGLHPKGEIVTNHLKKIHREVNGKREKVHDYVICIDGDGDIPFSNIFRVLDALLSGERVCLSCRQGEFRLGNPRDKIERFELNVLETIFNKSLPDGQCGCWGMHHSIVNNLNLSANGFEIELDILMNILKAGINPFFIPISIKQEEPSTFNVISHEEKIKFLCEKLNITPKDLNTIYSNFVLEYKSPLPKEYLQLDQFKAVKSKGKIKIIIKPKRYTCKCEKPHNKICNRCDRKKYNFNS